MTSFIWSSTWCISYAAYGDFDAFQNWYLMINLLHEKVKMRFALIFNRNSSRTNMLLQFQWYFSFRFGKFIFYIFNGVTYRIRIIFDSITTDVKILDLGRVFNIWFVSAANSYIAAKYRRFFLGLSKGLFTWPSQSMP